MLSQDVIGKINRTHFTGSMYPDLLRKGTPFLGERATEARDHLYFYDIPRSRWTSYSPYLLSIPRKLRRVRTDVDENRSSGCPTIHNK